MGDQSTKAGKKNKYACFFYVVVNVCCLLRTIPDVANSLALSYT